MKETPLTLYTIGLDLGVSSIGWSVVEMDLDNKQNISNNYKVQHDNNEDPIVLESKSFLANKLVAKRVIDCGVRLFEVAEVPKNLERRTKRGTRRRLKRVKQRIKRMKKHLMSKGFRINNYYKYENNKNPWMLRAKALNNQLSKEELAIAILHITKRRGFKSNRKEISTNDGGELKKYIDENEKK